MKIKILVVFLFLSLFASGNVVFADASTSPLTLAKIETGWGGEGIYFTTIEKKIIESCSGARFRLDKTNPMLKEILSIALSAYHSRSKVIFRVSGCGGNDMNVIAIGVTE